MLAFPHHRASTAVESAFAFKDGEGQRANKVVECSSPELWLQIDRDE
jgi:hypothetical protein